MHAVSPSSSEPIPHSNRPQAARANFFTPTQHMCSGSPAVEFTLTNSAERIMRRYWKFYCLISHNYILTKELRESCVLFCVARAEWREEQAGMLLLGGLMAACVREWASERVYRRGTKLASRAAKGFASRAQHRSGGWLTDAIYTRNFLHRPRAPARVYTCDSLLVICTWYSLYAALSAQSWGIGQIFCHRG
jgi:hypothetical protein